MSWDAVPFRVATTARPHASFSSSARYSPWSWGTAENRSKGETTSGPGPVGAWAAGSCSRGAEWGACC